MSHNLSAEPDVSIVLNMHREALFLRPTLRSLEACAKVARDAGIVVELVAVFDRPDADTIDTFRTTSLDGFVAINEITVDVGSLGLARNAGIEAARGEYVWTSDGDDLVSQNSLVELVATARRHPDRDIVVFLSYLVAFGDQFHVVRYREGTLLTIADFLFQHPYVSRIFIRRNALLKHKYRDIKVSPAFAYEDWDLNIRLYGAGFNFLIAENTILFYRQRQNSLLRQTEIASARIIPASDPLSPKRYLASLRSACANNDDWRRVLAERKRHSECDFAHELMSNQDLVAYVTDACAIEPEINPAAIEFSGSYSSLPATDDHWAFELACFYEMTGVAAFDDIVLLPWLRPGGAEKFILNILSSLNSLATDLRVLIIAGETAESHEWVYLLPENFVFIDLYNAFPCLDSDSRDAMLARAIVSLSRPGTRLHAKSSIFSHALINRYGAVFSECCNIVYYRFSDGRYSWRGCNLSAASTVEFLRRHLPNFDVVITDCHRIFEEDKLRFGAASRKYNVIYNKCDVVQRKSGSEKTFRVLWASRVAPEKRPELINQIVAAAREHFPDFSMDVWGSVEENSNEILKNFGIGVNYCGAYNVFSELDVDKYDALIYTSNYDGLPNIVLEALSSGLVVIAPNVGGIGEAVVSGETGFLVCDLQDDESLIQAYVAAIKALYDDWAGALDMGGKGQNLIRTRHCDDAFTQSVARVFSNVSARGQG
ncbi:glycosyltransferase [Camelimonas lactis]|uniref:Glycosyltransferase involved in cell wall biosynthesis n=1 Tax=Camelimonas lactis TaxID=659006 RepID=A0A4R2GXE7_9HYPH|nr:glycosyltransferase [Camelimonas lactis]TCO15890.1 glycosyltransferase involved in cell wall biosynthesis [Camelimonas lactis]